MQALTKGEGAVGSTSSSSGMVEETWDGTKAEAMDIGRKPLQLSMNREMGKEEDGCSPAHNC